MLWICGFLIGYLWPKNPKPINIYVNCEPVYYDGMTPDEFDIYLSEKEAKEARERMFKDFPELRYELLQAQFEYGEIDKETYDEAMKLLLQDIEIKI